MKYILMFMFNFTRKPQREIIKRKTSSMIQNTNLYINNKGKQQKCALSLATKQNDESILSFLINFAFKGFIEAR